MSDQSKSTEREALDDLIRVTEDEKVAKLRGGEVVDLSGIAEADASALLAGAVAVDLSGVDALEAKPELSQRVELNLDPIGQEQPDHRPPVLLSGKQFALIQEELAANTQTREQLALILHSLRPIRVVGLILVALFALDLIALLFPLNLLNPQWELGVINNLVERIIVPVLGTALFFWGGTYLRGKGDTFLLWFGSWTALWFGVALALLVPLTLLDTLRLQDAFEIELDSVMETQKGNFERIKQGLESATTLDELTGNFRRLTQMQIDLKPGTELETARAEMLTAINKRWEEFAQTQNESQERRALELWSKMLKMLMGLILSMGFYFYLWVATTWARELWVEQRGGLDEEKNRAQPVE